jgi:hypothetical protein
VRFEPVGVLDAPGQADPPVGVPLAVMPKGVEHSDPTSAQSVTRTVPLAVMPKGVEHERISLRPYPAALSPPCRDAERR